MQSIVQDDWENCYFPVCNNKPTDTHHVFGGSRRKHSDEDGLTIHVCRECHMEIHEGRKSWLLQALLHHTAQEEYEKTHTREEFVKRYGRNYI